MLFFFFHFFFFFTSNDISRSNQKYDDLCRVLSKSPQIWWGGFYYVIIMLLLCYCVVVIMLLCCYIRVIHKSRRCQPRCVVATPCLRHVQFRNLAFRAMLKNLTQFGVPQLSLRSPVAQLATSSPKPKARSPASGLAAQQQPCPLASWCDAPQTRQN